MSNAPTINQTLTLDYHLNCKCPYPVITPQQRADVKEAISLAQLGQPDHRIGDTTAQKIIKLCAVQDFVDHGIWVPAIDDFVLTHPDGWNQDGVDHAE